MTEFDLQKTLFNRFNELNTFSGIDFLTEKNVHFPNRPFIVPCNKRYFNLTFKSNEPEEIFTAENDSRNITGILYIEVITPQDSGEDEIEAKYKWISRLFYDADFNEDVIINKVYIANKGNEADYYRLLIAIEWEAFIDKELKE